MNKRQKKKHSGTRVKRDKNFSVEAMEAEIADLFIINTIIMQFDSYLREGVTIREIADAIGVRPKHVSKLMINPDTSKEFVVYMGGLLDSNRDKLRNLMVQKLMKKEK